MPSDSAAVFYSTFETGRHYKVHKSYIWVAPIVAVLAVLIVSMMNGAQGIAKLVVAVSDGDIAVNPLFALLGTVGGLAVLIGIFVGIYALAYKNMSYVFDEREFSFYSGIITKRRVHMPYARVQSVNHRASLIQRLFGVCTVAIDSAGGSSNKAVRVPYLRLETAERLRAELFVRKAAVAAGRADALTYVPHADTATVQGTAHEAALMQQRRAQAPEMPGAIPPSAAGQPGLATAQGAQGPNILDTSMGVVGDWRGLYGGSMAIGEEPVAYERGLANHELLLTGISHDSPLITGVIVALTFAAIIIVLLLADQREALRVVPVLAPLAIGLTFFSWAIGLISVMVSFGNFRARRRGSRIEVERGLLARRFSGIDIDRIQSIEVRQSFVRHLIGYCEVSLGRIDTAGEGGSDANGSKMNAKGLVIHPFVKVDHVDEILNGLLPEFSGRPVVDEARSLPRVAVRRALVRRCVLYNWLLWVFAALVVVAGLVIGVTHGFAALQGPAHTQVQSALVNCCIVVGVVTAAFTAARAVGAVWWARRSRFSWNKGYLLLHNDGLSTQTSIVPRSKVQAGVTRDNPFQRRLDLTGIQAITAAGTRSTTAALIDVPASAGAAYLRWLEPGGSEHPCA